MTKRKQRSSKDEQRTRALVFAVGALLLAMVMCVSVVGGGAFWFINSTSSRIADDSDFAPTRPTWADDSAALQVAVSPVMAPVLAGLAEQFNAQAQRTPDGQATNRGEKSAAVVPAPAQTVGNAFPGGCSARADLAASPDPRATPVRNAG